MATATGKRGKTKMLRPPFRWSGKSLLENPDVKRWSRAQVRAMRNGTYDWANHAERKAA